MAAREPVGAPPRPVLPPAPVVERRGRGRGLAVLGLLLVAVLGAVLLVSNLRSGGDGDPTAASATSPPAGTRASETTQEAPSTTAATSTTRTSSTRSAGGALPEGWRLFTNARGSNRVGVPPGFRERVRQSFNATVVEEQGGARRVFTVRSTNPANPLPQASRDYRIWARENFQGFREIRYQENQTYAGHQGAVVFEYQAVRDGRRVQVSHINLKGKTWGYNVELIVPVDQWGASQELARQFEQAFRTLG